MRKAVVCLALIACWTGLSGTEAGAAPFEPLFQVTSISGTCKVNLPGSSEYVDAQVGKGYAFGTTVVTSPGSSVSIAFSAGNTCELLAGTTATIDEDSTDPTRKAIRLIDGKVDVALEADYSENNTLDVVTRCASVELLAGGNTSVDVKSEADLRVAVVTCAGAELGITGPSYEIPLLKEDDAITVACSDDRGFIRIRDIEGNYDIQVQDHDGGIRMIQMVKDSVVKILRKPSDADESIMIVTFLVIGPDGEIVDAQSVTEEREYEPDEPGTTSLPPETTGGGPTFPPTTSSTTTTTTTTTIPTGDTTTTTVSTSTTTTRRRTTTTTKKKDDMTPVGQT